MGARMSVVAGFDWPQPMEAPSLGNPLADHPGFHLQFVFRDFFISDINPPYFRRVFECRGGGRGRVRLLIDNKLAL
jgi:hypothetical protein